ncbi:MAG: 2Fe-2S iron-sulfur cluster-binding protein [Woeseiaceae bacterium]|nr:2Fe-2S iron-sulfur cluster-binding protein [Woeseiaceae bacterium]
MRFTANRLAACSPRRPERALILARVFATDRVDSQYAVEALCGGSCQCATCHVFIAQPWLDLLKPQTDFELATLESKGSEIRPTSRLSCQIQWQAELDSIVVTVAP